MTDKLKQTIKEELGKLPKTSQDAINSLNWVEITEAIGKKHALDESEVNALQVETLLALTGITDATLYVNNLENQMGLTKDMAEQIGNEVLEKIFNPIVNVMTENIKKDIKNRNPDWKQSINFIISGGNYAALMDTAQIEELKK